MTTDKPLATLQAAAALRGIVVQPLPDGGAYLVAQGAWMSECEDFAALRAMLERMGIWEPMHG